MNIPLLSRSFRRRYSRLKYLLFSLMIILFLDAVLITSHNARPFRSTKLPPHLVNEKIFIASIHRNSEYMLRLYWNSALLRLVRALGPQNVYVSILESGSQENTKDALRDLETKLNELGVENSIQLGVNSTEQMTMLKQVPDKGKREGWIETGRGESGWEMRRIPYLARLRNQAMEPLWERERNGKDRFDRVLWINDVVFTTEDILTLLSTRDGYYASVCALDFGSKPSYYYDTFALRDINGHKTATLRYPYFHDTASLALLSHLLPIPVRSCWNGIISMTASPFYDDDDDSKPQALNFRGVPDSLARLHVEGSECCLIHADNPLTATLGNWVNPNVRVSYDARVYSRVNGDVEVKSDIMNQVFGRRGREQQGRWPRVGEKIRGTWANRMVRATGWGRVLSEQWWAERVVGRWVREGKAVGEQRREAGEECLVNEMQVLFQNGWQHV